MSVHKRGRIFPWRGGNRFELLLDGPAFFPRMLAAIEGAVEGRTYLVGDSFTAADLYLASHLSWGMNFGTLEKRPAFETYAERHLQRPAALRADEIDNALIAAAAQPSA